MRLKNLLVSLVFILAISATTTTAQQRQDWSGFKDLTFEVTTPKKRYVQLQPVPLVLTLSNQTDRVLKGHSALAFYANHVNVWTRAEGAEWRKIDQLSMLRALIYVNPRDMSPGDKFTDTQLLNLQIEKIFPQPGMYDLKAVIMSADGLQTVESRPIRFRIEAPEGADLEAYNFLHAHTNPEYFYTGSGLVRNKTAEQTLETFVAKFEETAYGNDARFLLGQLRFATRDYEAARLLFERLAKTPDFALAASAKEYLARIQKRQP
ncbi:MAG TPA: hypothetical protein VGD38_07750 [Pyrinomonadaceae bacterium]